MKYKCHTCHLILEEEHLVNGSCPECSNPVEEMCIKDHNHCPHDVVSGIAYCEVCGKPCCPICESHSVSQISRVTGYLSEINAYNESKRQEIKDRIRYDPLSGDREVVKANMGGKFH